MGSSIARVLLACFAVSLMAGPSRGQLLRPPATEPQIVGRATAVLQELHGLRVQQIPHSLLTSAEAVAIVPGMVRGAFVVGLQHGRGVLLTKNPAGDWAAPQFITLNGGSVGWQAGIQATDLVLVFASRGSVHNLLQGKITVGVDASAAAGPVGRRASAATDLPLQAEIYSYSRSRGLFAGVSLDGSSLQMDPASTNRYYATAPEGAIPPSAAQLIAHLRAFTGPNAALQQPGLQQPGLQQPGLQQPGLQQPGLAPAVPLGPAAPSDTVPAPALGGTPASGASLSGRWTPAPEAGVSAAQVQQQLADAARRLDPLLNPQWKGYLRLPDQLAQQAAAPAPDSAALRETLQRYDAVAADQQYAELNQRAEFQQVHRLLRQWAELAASGPLSLPPPPAGR